YSAYFEEYHLSERAREKFGLEPCKCKFTLDTDGKEDWHSLLGGGPIKKRNRLYHSGRNQAV
ncbi:MAG: hypothetical protein V2A34_13480, partial [Lentisphaerota bacterium]